MKERVLITGGAGFQGSHITEFLISGGYDVTILNTFSRFAQANTKDVAGGPRIVWGSVTDPEVVNKAVENQDIVVHMAARTHVGESTDDPRSHVLVNVGGTLNVLEAVRKHADRIRLIHWSTCEVYGEPVNGKLKEDSEFRPKSPYAASKAAADRLCYAYGQSYGVNATIVRPFNVFGERQKTGSSGAVIPIFVENALKNHLLTVHGNGEQSRDYLYISDLVQAFQLVLTHPELAGQAINFASGINTMIKTIAEYIASRLDSKIEFGPGRSGEVLVFPANIDRAKSFGFEPKATLFEGIDRYISWKLEQEKK